MLLVFSVLGLIGGLLCCVGDILFDLKGKGIQSGNDRCRQMQGDSGRCFKAAY